MARYYQRVGRLAEGGAPLLGRGVQDEVAVRGEPGLDRGHPPREQGARRGDQGADRPDGPRGPQRPRAGQAEAQARGL